MLFDSEEIKQLCLDYADEPDFAVPEIVRLTRSPLLDGERAEIEHVFQALPESVRKDWRSRLVSTDYVQYKSTWFQIMLFSWFRSFASVIAEPEILGNRPDFLLEIEDSQIAIEARAVLVREQVRIREMWEREVQWLLNRIEEPSFAVHIEEIELASRIDTSRFLEQVVSWLHNAPETAFQYKDEQDNRIALKTLWRREQGGVATAGPSRSFWIDPSQFQRPLREKAHQHRAIRKSNLPYVIAINLEDRIYSAEEIAEAWFGRQTAIVDIHTATIVDQRLDMSGIHYYGREIRHRSVTGTLVFHDWFHEQQRCRQLRAWYIQNPYATKPIDPAIFPVTARFVVQNQDERRYRMGWEYDAIQEAEP